jgi:predicted ATP-dependent protease
VRQGNFHIWAVKNVDEGLEVLTGRPAQEVHTAAKARLTELVRILKEHGDS